MLHRFAWSLILLIYLLINGQVFAVHLCQSMANTNTSLSTPSNTVKNHQHHAGNDEKTQSVNEAKKNQQTSTMENCLCVDCDCTTSICSQVTAYITTDININFYLPTHTTSVSQGSKNVISPLQVNPLRPPIVA